jgi:hypothetical protein
MRARSVKDKLARCRRRTAARKYARTVDHIAPGLLVSVPAQAYESGHNNHPAHRAYAYPCEGAELAVARHCRPVLSWSGSPIGEMSDVVPYEIIDRFKTQDCYQMRA